MLHNNRVLRHELKIFITPLHYEILKMRIQTALMPDKNSINGGYRVTSLYFDDIYRSSYNDKIMGIKTRRKYRIRTYNLSPEHITLEVKYKDDAYISKTKARLTRGEYDLLLAGDCGFYFENESWHDTALEDFVISNTLTRPRPSVIVDYYREAFVNRAGNVRITFDKKLSTCYNTIDMFCPEAIFSPVFGGETADYNNRANIILEIKYDDFLPSFIEELLACFPLWTEAISKFTICTDKLLEVKKQCAF